MTSFDIESIKSSAMTSNDFQVRIRFNDFTRNRCNSYNHSIWLILFHICQNIFRFKTTATN